MSSTGRKIVYPVKTVWHDFEVPFVDNESVKWKGQLALLVDAEGKVFQSYDLVFETPWYYCVSCDERLSVGSNFCPKCGSELDWAHTSERDKDSLAALTAAVDQRIAEAKDA